jgi:endogenous inhibitor of DNA gyrase (YacG/DUF329 family)
MRCPKCGAELTPDSSQPSYGTVYCCERCRIIIIELKVSY